MQRLQLGPFDLQRSSAKFLSWQMPSDDCPGELEEKPEDELGPKLEDEFGPKLEDLENEDDEEGAKLDELEEGKLKKKMVFIENLPIIIIMG